MAKKKYVRVKLDPAAQNTGSQAWRTLRPTGEQEARIQAGIAQDPDAREIKPEEWKEMRPRKEILAERRAARGRPKAEVTKEQVTIRYDAEVLAFFRATGAGWQTRMNAALLEYVRQQRAR